MSKKNHSFARMTLAAALMMAFASLTPAADEAPNSSTTPFLPSTVVTVSTVPSNGDVNPYGVAFVPQGFPAGGVLKAGDILVSNF
jgi:hypothetical protein